MSSGSDAGTMIAEAKRLVRERQPRRAIEIFQQALQEHGPSSELHQGLAAAYFSAGDLPQAAEQFQRVLALQPGNGHMLVNLGAVYNRMGDHKKAVETLRKGIQKETRCSEGFYNLGIAERKLGNIKLAIAAYREALRLKPDMAEAHQNLANILFEQGNVQQAIIHYRKALEIAPDLEGARRGLARAEGTQEKTRDAANPFGRLVGQQASQQQPEAVAVRPMSADERRRDREILNPLVARIQSATAGCLEHLKGSLEPSLLALTRSVAQQDTSSMQMWTGYSNFCSAVESTNACRERLRQAMEELRDHERETAAPRSA